MVAWWVVSMAVHLDALRVAKWAALSGDWSAVWTVVMTAQSMVDLSAAY